MLSALLLWECHSHNLTVSSPADLKRLLVLNNTYHVHSNNCWSAAAMDRSSVTPYVSVAASRLSLSCMLLQCFSSAMRDTMAFKLSAQ